MDRFRQLLLEYTIEDVEKVYGQWASKVGLDLKEALERLHKLWGNDSEIPFYILTKVLSVVKNEMKGWNSVSAKDIETYVNLTINLEGLRIMHEIKNSGKQAINDLLTTVEQQSMEFFPLAKTAVQLGSIARNFARLQAKWKTYKEYQKLNKSRAPDFKTDSARIYRVKNFAEMKKLGFGTTWCVTMSNYWNIYSRFSDLYVIIPDKRETYMTDNTTFHTKYLVSILKPQHKHLLTWWNDFIDTMNYFKSELKDWDIWVSHLMRDTQNDFHYLLDDLFDDYITEVEEILKNPEYSRSKLGNLFINTFYNNPSLLEAFLMQLTRERTATMAFKNVIEYHLKKKLPRKMQTDLEVIEKMYNEMSTMSWLWREISRQETKNNIARMFLIEMGNTFVRYSDGLKSDFKEYIDDILNIAGAESFEDLENFSISIFLQAANEQDDNEEDRVRPAIYEIKKVPELHNQYETIKKYMESEIGSFLELFIENELDDSSLLSREIYLIVEQVYNEDPEIKKNIDEYVNLIRTNYKKLVDLQPEVIRFREFVYYQMGEYMSEYIKFEKFSPNMVAKYLPDIKRDIWHPEHPLYNIVKELENVVKSAGKD